MSTVTHMTLTAHQHCLDVFTVSLYMSCCSFYPRPCACHLPLYSSIGILQDAPQQSIIKLKIKVMFEEFPLSAATGLSENEETVVSPDSMLICTSAQITCLNYCSRKNLCTTWDEQPCASWDKLSYQLVQDFVHMITH